MTGYFLLSPYSTLPKKMLNSMQFWWFVLVLLDHCKNGTISPLEPNKKLATLWCWSTCLHQYHGTSAARVCFKVFSFREHTRNWQRRRWGQQCLVMNNSPIVPENTEPTLVIESRLKVCELLLLILESLMEASFYSYYLFLCLNIALLNYAFCVLQ